jgi:hypothetical protein
VLIQRLQHYFSTYKMGPNMTSGVEITATYGREHAGAVVSAAIQDYQDVFGPSHRAWEKLEERDARRWEQGERRAEAPLAQPSSSSNRATNSSVSLWRGARWISGRHCSCDSRILMLDDSLVSSTGRPSSRSSSTSRCGRLARARNWLMTMPSTCRSGLWSARVSSTFSSSVVKRAPGEVVAVEGDQAASAAISADRV